MDLESQNSKDARVEKLWRKLDTEGKGELDLNGLKQGMIKINHRQLAKGGETRHNANTKQHSNMPIRYCLML